MYYYEARYRYINIAVGDVSLFEDFDIYQAVTNYTDAKLIAELSTDLGEAMVGINEQEIELLMAERGK